MQLIYHSQKGFRSLVCQLKISNGNQENWTDWWVAVSRKCLTWSAKVNRQSLKGREFGWNSFLETTVFTQLHNFQGNSIKLVVFYLAKASLPVFGQKTTYKYLVCIQTQSLYIQGVDKVTMVAFTQAFPPVLFIGCFTVISANFSTFCMTPWLSD